MVPAIIFALKPLLDTFADKLAILLEELLILSKFCLYSVIDKIFSYIEYMKKCKIIFLTLESLK